MSWLVFLEDENRAEVDALDKEFFLKSLKDVDRDEFKLIKYIDPHGDTVFNGLQMKDLIADFETVSKLEPDNKLIDEVIRLAKQCSEQSRMYITFYGDYTSKADIK